MRWISIDNGQFDDSKWLAAKTVLLQLEGGDEDRDQPVVGESPHAVHEVGVWDVSGRFYMQLLVANLLGSGVNWYK
jgi:hypothetical protein